jgi:hypothetical protein
MRGLAFCLSSTCGANKANVNDRQCPTAVCLFSHEKAFLDPIVHVKSSSKSFIDRGERGYALHDDAFVGPILPIVLCCGAVVTPRLTS